MIQQIHDWRNVRQRSLLKEIADSKHSLDEEELTMSKPLSGLVELYLHVQHFMELRQSPISWLNIPFFFVINSVY